MRIGSLFSGCGGLDLGLERSGLGKVAWACEALAFNRGILRKHWPDVPIYEDVVGLDPPPADIVCGGFPCTDLSDASRGRGAGLAGAESGLWFEMLRIVEATSPALVIVENVDGAARKRWVPVVRRGLHGRGFDSLQIRVRACDVGGPFKGSRVFVLAAPYCKGQPTLPEHEQMAGLREAAAACWQDWGQPSSEALGVAHGLPRGVDSARRGAVVPQVAKAVGRFALFLKQKGWWGFT